MTRISVPLSDEVRAVFEALAEVQGKSLGSTISEWLTETVEGAQLMTETIRRAKQSPARALRELGQVAAEFESRLVDSRRDLSDALRAKPRTRSTAPPGRAGGTSTQSGVPPVRRRRSA